MSGSLSRREFLKIAGLSLGSLAFAAYPDWPRPPEYDQPLGRGRVTIRAIYVYKEPDFQSQRTGTRKRDQILPLYEEIQSRTGPRHNPLWYRIKDGFVHSGYLQRVERAHLNQPLDYVPESGRLGEITIPFTQALRKTYTYGWVPLYRLYYESVFWITSIDQGPDGSPWYGLTDDLLHVKYHVPAEYIRPIEPEELAPISPNLPAGEKRIEVSIADQTLTAFEGDHAILQTTISSGIPSKEPTPNGISTATPAGYWHVEVKVPSRHMGDGALTDDLEAYELPGVPWVSFFHITGVAFHGTYWHNHFGRMMSHGCVNMRSEDARWIYRWTNPYADYRDWNRKGHGTLVRVI